jgi:ADP-heptose:LPS heptosyltransferase
MIAGDTGPLQIAAAAGTPIIGLFGPTDPERNGPWDPADVTLSRYEACVCHYRRRCRRKTECLADISVEDLVAAIDRRLRQRPNGSRLAGLARFASSLALPAARALVLAL